MSTIQQAWLTAQQALDQGGLPTAKLDTQYLLEYILNEDSSFLVMHPDHILSTNQTKQLKGFVKRRLAREPISKIIGTKDFWDLSFFTTTDTLDPRPDSETLIENIFKILPEKTKKLRILDIGTGTGCLLLTLLNQYKNAGGVGIDICEKALVIAEKNALNLNLENRVTFIQSNWLESVVEQFDIIVSNPPYIPTMDMNSLEPELRFDPKNALSYTDRNDEKTKDGLSAYRIIAKQCRTRLKPGGLITVEFGKGQHDDVKTIFQWEGYIFRSFKKDLSHTIRCATFEIYSFQKGFI